MFMNLQQLETGANEADHQGASSEGSASRIANSSLLLPGLEIIPTLSGVALIV
jgi:hypothetical protein